MKCLCGFQQMPNNTHILARHMQECDNGGPLSSVESPVVVWREGEFVVVREAEKDEQVFEVPFTRVPHLTQEDVIKLEPDYDSLPEEESVEEPVEE